MDEPKGASSLLVSRLLGIKNNLGLSQVALDALGKLPIAAGPPEGQSSWFQIISNLDYG